MNLQRLLLTGFGAMFVHMVTGCSSPAGDSKAGSPTPILSGQYTPTNAGPISEISFYDSSYVLWTSPCSDGSGAATCMEEGTFTVNGAQTELTLTNSATGKSTTLALHVLEGGTVAEQALAPSGDLTAEDLRLQGGSLTGDGGGLTGGGGTSLYNGDGGTLTAQVNAPVVTSGNLNDQNVSRSGPKPKCVFDDTFQGPAATLLSTFQALVQKNSGTFTGDATQGSVEVSGVGATYRINGQSIHIEVTHKPFIASCGKISGFLSGDLGLTSSQ